MSCVHQKMSMRCLKCLQQQIATSNPMCCNVLGTYCTMSAQLPLLLWSAGGFRAHQLDQFSGVQQPSHRGPIIVHVWFLMLPPRLWRHDLGKIVTHDVI